MSRHDHFRGHVDVNALSVNFTFVQSLIDAYLTVFAYCSAANRGTKGKEQKRLPMMLLID